VGKRAEELRVVTKDGDETFVPLRDVCHLAIYGNVQVTTSAL